VTVATAEQLATLSFVGIALAFGFGAATALGPCTFARLSYLIAAPRLLPSTVAVVSSYVFTLALVGATGVFVMAAIFTISPWIYALLGLLSVVIGASILWKGYSPHDHHHADNGTHSIPRSLALGSLSALSFSPCCGTALLTILAVAHDPLTAAGLMAAYGIGHQAPLVVLPLLRTESMTRVLQRLTSPIAILIGTLAIITGLSYMVLA